MNDEPLDSLTIMGHRGVPGGHGNKKREFLVHRLGTGYDQDSWECETALVDHAVPLREYWAKTNRDVAAARRLLHSLHQHAGRHTGRTA